MELRTAWEREDPAGFTLCVDGYYRFRTRDLIGLGNEIAELGRLIDEKDWVKWKLMGFVASAFFFWVNWWFQTDAEQGTE